MNKGFMYLHRQLLNWEWFDNSNMVHVWIYFLLKANYQDVKWHGIDIPRGSFVTSLDDISKKTRLSVREVRTCISRLKSTGEVTIKTTSKYSIVTICKYDDYNKLNSESDKQSDKQIDKQATSKRQTNDKQTTTDNKYNNIEESKKESKEEYIPSSLRSDGLSSETDDGEKINDFNALVSFFNEIIDKHNSCIPKIKAIENNRRKAVNARVREYGRKALVEVFSKAATSDYLNGKNSYSFVASFDWLIRPNNFPKVLEGNYNDRDKQDRQKEKVDEKMAVGQILTPSREEWGKVEANEFFKNKP